ncbi:MAG TPA: response regulator [Candidatus Sulfotelmatobacter sp.]|nr:response regulator [Candidatus Sulfotelmatobacter sp.]
MDILIIEPDKVLSDIYLKTLKCEGYNARIARSAQSALDAADHIKPDLVILELQLVEHSGIEFLYEFRSYAEWSNVPILIYTSVPPTEFSDSWQILKNEIKISKYLCKTDTDLKRLLGEIKGLIGRPSEKAHR